MKTCITTFTFLLISLFGYAQNSAYAKLDSYFATLEQNDRFFGSVAVSRAGEIIYSNTIGYADMEASQTNTKDTKFRVGSISKTFTATLVMKGVEMEKIKLEDNINKFFPNIQNADKITVRQLLNHRSGINSFTDRSFLSWYTKPISPSALLDTIVAKGVDFVPNAKHEYSNSNYVLLTFILEEIFEKTYPELLAQYIIKPLNLTNTRYGSKIDPTQNEARSYKMNTSWTLEPEGDMSIPLGAGGIISTPTDLCLFAEALFDGKLVSTQSLQQMNPVGEEEYGFALYDMEVDQWNGLGHGGAIDAFSSTFTYFEDSDICIALTCNGSNYGLHDIAIAVLSEVFGKPYDLPNFDFVELTSEDLDQYLGTYESNDLPMDMIIRKEGSTLFLEATGQSASPLLAEGNHNFSIMKYGVKVKFMPNEKKMKFEQQGMEFEMTMKSSDHSNVSNTVSQKEDLDQYLGTYGSDQLPMDLTISKDGNKLIGQGTGQPSFSLEAIKEHVFSNKEIGLVIIFSPAEKKMFFEQGGANFEMDLKLSDNAEVSNTENLDQFVGTYVSDQLPMDLKISKKGNSLIGQGTGQPSFPLESDGENLFSNKEIGLVITFAPDEKKMVFEQGGAAFEMKQK